MLFLKLPTRVEIKLLLHLKVYIILHNLDYIVSPIKCLDVKCLLEHLLLYILDNPKLNSVVLYIDAPFYDDPIPPNGVPGQAYFKVCNKSKD